MGAQRVEVERPCPRCGATARVQIAARFADGTLRHTESLHCPGCRYALETYGGELASDVRDALCAVHGRWSASVRDLGPDRPRALVALRDFLGVAPTELMRVVREATPIARGVLVEIERAQAALEPAGIQLAVVPVTG